MAQLCGIQMGQCWHQRIYITSLSLIIKRAVVIFLSLLMPQNHVEVPSLILVPWPGPARLFLPGAAYQVAEAMCRRAAPSPHLLHCNWRLSTCVPLCRWMLLCRLPSRIHSVSRLGRGGSLLRLASLHGGALVGPGTNRTHVRTACYSVN